MKKIFFVGCFLLISFNFVFAESEKNDTSDTFYISVKGKSVPARIKSMEVITATRLLTPKTEIASSITVITTEDIQKKKETSVIDVLKDVPGINVVQNGGNGQSSSIFIRGSKSEHTLVMIDGIEINDPMSPGRDAELSNLSLENVERIEILRGAQSTLYGSDAMAGVINIITKKGSGKAKISLTAEAGSFKTFKEGVDVSGGNDRVNYSLGIFQINTEGISAAGSKYGNTEKDGYSNTSFSTRLGFMLSENYNMDVILTNVNSKTDLDNSGGTNGDDPSYVFKNRQLFFSTRFNLPSLLKEGKQELQLSFSRYTRDYNNEKDTDHPNDFSTENYVSQIRKVNWQHNILPDKTNNVLLGLEYEEEKGRTNYYSESAWGPFTSIFNEEKVQTKGYYIQDQISIQNKFFTTLGVRLDDHETFGSRITYRIAPAYLIEKTNTKFKATYGTGFKSPSLYQLYSSYGDVNLKPEESRSWDAGFEQHLMDKKLLVECIYFNNDFSNLIDYDFVTSKYKNISGARTEGVELGADFKLTDNLVVKGNGTTMFKIKDENTNEDLIRRTKNKFSVNTNYQFSPKGNIDLGLVHVGKRNDKDFSTSPATDVKLGSYDLVNVNVTYNLGKNFQIFAKANNIFDKDYEEIYGYGTPRTSFYFGLKSDF